MLKEQMTEREEAISRAKQWVRKIPDVPCERFTTNREGGALSLLHLSIEHFSGLLCLVDHNLDSSALALLRPQWEAYVRGIWVHASDNDKDVERFLENKHISLKLPDMIASLQPEDRRAPLAAQNASVTKGFNDFTHGGMRQLAARNQEGNIETIFSDKEIAASVYMSMMFSYQAIVEIADVLKQDALRQSLLNDFGAAFPPQ